MGRKTLVFSTLAVAFGVFSLAVVYQVFREKNAAVIVNAKEFPTIGKPSAPVEIVLIEDFQCHNCRAFSQKIIPRIQSEYIQTGKVRFILVPVAFLLGSQAIANAALEVYQQRPEKFFPYLRKVLKHEGDLRQKDLVKLAGKVGGIDLEKLQKCIEQKCHNRALEKNLNWALEIMGPQFRTPALYINGAPGSTFSFEAIQYQIDQILGTK